MIPFPVWFIFFFIHFQLACSSLRPLLWLPNYNVTDVPFIDVMLCLSCPCYYGFYPLYPTRNEPLCCTLIQREQGCDGAGCKHSQGNFESELPACLASSILTILCFLIQHPSFQGPVPPVRHLKACASSCLIDVLRQGQGEVGNKE